MAPQPAADHVGADVGGNYQEAGQQGEGEPGAGGPGLAGQVGRQSVAGQVAQTYPIAGQKTQIKQPEN